jgi:uncharacterized surface protein with fasciclin (FAS1) repeats
VPGHEIRDVGRIAHPLSRSNKDEMTMFKLARIASIAAAAVATVGLAFSPVASANGPKGPTIVQVALAANGPGGLFENQLNTLIAAVLAADPIVLDRLSGNGKLTVFAPTDSAFALIGLTPGNVNTVDTALLTQVLLYHVARGERTAADVVPAERIRMLAGGFLYKEAGSTQLIDNLGRPANIIATDVKAANGVIHAIDAVVLPVEP